MSKQKFKAKMQKMGAWTIIVTPVNVRKIFGTAGHVRVKGTINGFPFDDTSLMPMGTGEHCMPVKTTIRKQIKKEAGDTIEVILEQDFAETKIPEELAEALEASPEAEKMFNAYSPSHKRNYIKYISESKKKETREKRAVDCVLRIEKEYFEKGLPDRKKK
ncbi:MAG: YdeI/OmpD-associated family protein [Bacteroidia bacterium]